MIEIEEINYVKKPAEVKNMIKKIITVTIIVTSVTYTVKLSVTELCEKFDSRPRCLDGAGLSHCAELSKKQY